MVSNRISKCRVKQKLILLVISVLMLATVFAQTNLGFETGLAGWSVFEGPDIISGKNGPFEGNSCVRIVKRSGRIQQKIETVPFSIVRYKTFIKSSIEGVTGYSFIRFYNASDQLLLEFNSKPVSSVDYQSTGNYTLTPPVTKYFTIGVIKDSAGGSIFVDDFSIEIELPKPAIQHKFRYDACQYMNPFWNSDTIYNETVLLYSTKGQAATGKLLYRPSRILSVKSFNLDTTFQQHKDYTIHGNTITRAKTSKMSFRTDSSFEVKNLAWYNLQSQWVVVTYLHKEKWNRVKPVYKGNNVPRTIAKLSSKAPVKIIAYGMSITRGMNVSGYDTVPPFMPSYVDMFGDQLKKLYDYNDITVYNAGLPGAVVDWGAQYADKYISPVDPDLVIIDFGMNDFWRYTPVQFKGYVQTIIAKVKSANPGAEFLLLSNMKFDPDYIMDSDKNKNWYLSNMEGYGTVLREMQSRGIINLDMTSLSDVIYKKKKARDCLANPLHPNDYMARWYAQGMTALFQKQ